MVSTGVSTPESFWVENPETTQLPISYQPRDGTRSWSETKSSWLHSIWSHVVSRLTENEHKICDRTCSPRSCRDFAGTRIIRKARTLLDTLELRALGGRQVALAAADNYHALCRRGITPRKTIGMIIGTYCLVHDLKLFHANRNSVFDKRLFDDILTGNSAATLRETPRNQHLTKILEHSGVAAQHRTVVFPVQRRQLEIVEQPTIFN